MAHVETPASNEALVLDFLSRVFEQADLAAIDVLVALPSLRGLLRSDVPGMHETLGGVRCPVRQTVSEGDRVAVEFELTGVPREGDADSPVSVLNLAVFRVANGKIVGASVLADRLAMLQQLGVEQVPPLAPCPVT